MVRPEVRLAFSVRIVPGPGVTEPMTRLFLRALEDYAEGHGLVLHGTQLLWHVSSDERSLTDKDQVDLLDWLVDRPLVREVMLTPLSDRTDPVASLQDGFVTLRSCDLCAVGLTLLYRCGRLTPPMYLEVLGGYVRPALH